MSTLTEKINRCLPEVIALRHDLHQHPEIGYEETETAAKVVARLERTGCLKVETGIAKTGVVATLGAEKTGKCIALRADMDCLPILEESGKPWSSKQPGLMHACGHDGHTSCLLGSALVLSEIRDSLKGPVKFIFQPAEEGGAGGREMVEAGVLENPSVEMIFGLHGWPNLELGSITTCSGPMMANADKFQIQILGKGGHAAVPHQCVSPIEIAARVTTQLNALTTPDPITENSAVVTVAKIEGGTAFNIIPDTVTLLGTIRTLSDETQSGVFNKIDSIAQAAAQTLGGQADVTIKKGYPVVVNHPRAYQYLAQTFGRAGSPINQSMEGFPQMVGEDFAYYGHKIPACFFGLGLRPRDSDTYPHLHQAQFDFNDDALPIGMRCFIELVVNFWN